MAGRGTDLLLSDPYSHTTALDLGGAEAAIWGTACVVSSAVVLLGLCSRRYAVLANGCFMAFATYTMFSWYVMDETVLMFPPDNWRVFLDHLATGLVWLTLGASISFRAEVLKRHLAKGG